MKDKNKIASLFTPLHTGRGWGWVLLLLLVGCGDKDIPMAELTGTEDQTELTIDVVETGWQGETVNLSTRSGETLESLRDVYPARDWDSFQPNGDDRTALNAATSLWAYDEGTKTYTSLVAFDGTLTGGAEGTTELSCTKELHFSAASDNIQLVDDGDNSYIQFSGILTINNLKAGQTVTIQLKSPAGTRMMTANNFSGSPVIPATAVKASQTRTVANTGSVSFSAADAINIYSINVSRAEDLGFGIYCSELNYSNTQVTWAESYGRWNIGENNYNTYWKSSEGGTINVYAYAPFKAGGYTYSEANNKLTFAAQKHSYPGSTGLLSGGNVDLLHAHASLERSSNQPAILTFRHSLAKLTFGTITNNTGETLLLNGFTVRGTLNSEAKLNLSDGSWSDHSSSSTTITLPPPFVYVVHSAAELAGDPPSGYASKALIEPIADKQTVLPTMSMGRSILLIPNSDGKITVTVEVHNSGETFSFPVTLEEGKEKIINITVEKNFEVEIE